MFALQRQMEILKIINEQGSIKVTDIQQKFNVGYETAKKDLVALESKGKIKRTYGGAIRIDHVNDIINEADEKKGLEILKIIVPKLKDSNNIFIESNILKFIDIDTMTFSGVITTNSIKIGTALLKNNNNVSLLGGKYNTFYNTYDTIDLDKFKNNIYFDKCIFCADFITENGEYGINNRELYELLKRLIKISKGIICLYKNGINGILISTEFNNIITL